MSKLCLVIIAFAICLVSCDHDVAQSDSAGRNLITKNLNPIDTVEISRELSIAVGRAIANRSSRNNVVALSQALDTFGDAVSIAALLEAENFISDFEKKRLVELSTDLPTLINGNLFKRELLHELKKESRDYPTILQNVNLSDNDIDDQLTNLVAGFGLEIYIPYAENFDWTNITSYVTTYENNSINDLQFGQEFTGIDWPQLCTCPPMSTNPVQGVDDDFVFIHPSFGITPIIPSYNGNDNPLPVMDGTPPSGQGTPMPGPADPRVLLTYNVNPNTLPANPNNYIITTDIPKIRVRGTGWKRTLSKALRLLIIRAYSDLALTPSGTYTSAKLTYQYRKDISAKDLRDERWVTVNWQWDPNWTAIETTQQILVLVKRGDAGNTNYDVNTKLSLNAQGEYTPTTTVTVNHTGSKSETYLKGNRELDRSQVLTTIVDGSEPGNPTYSHNLVNYSVRKIDKFEYFFEHHYTYLP